ncbi:MAG: hypothetical protein Q4F00_10320 [bacterium]|nr:hypothetical protein [bacterium]
MKLTRLGVTLCLAAMLFLSACQAKVTMAPPETFDISGQKITFAPPPDSWGSKTIASIPPENSGSNSKTPETVVSFKPDFPNSSLTVSGLVNWPQASWDENQEETNKFTEQVQNQILKRSQGEIVKQRQTKLDNEIALELEVRYMDATTPMHGKQIYAIHNKTLMVISLNVPEDKWNENASVYDQLVKSWKFN